MKKTTLALSALSLAMLANSAAAYTFIDSQDTGTKAEFIGSARLMWRSTSDKTTPAASTDKHVNHAVANNGSRFGFRLTQQLGNGFYALGRVEWRFRGTSSSQHDFDDIYTRQLYAGFGHKQYGELTYGNMTTITDEVKQTDLPNTLSLSDGLLTSNARRAVQYVYKGIEGLKTGVFYAGRNQRGSNGLDLANERKDVWGFGAIYNYKIDEQQSVKVGTGFTREHFEQNAIADYQRNAYSLGTAYTFGKTTVGVDLERRETKDQGAIGNKRKEREVRTVLFHRLTDDWNAYTMYAYKTNKLNAVGALADTENKRHQFMLGTEYYIVPKHLKGFVEWQTSRGKNYTNGVKTNKVRNNQTVIGLRAYW